MPNRNRRRIRRDDATMPARPECPTCGEPMRYEQAGDVYVHAFTGGVRCAEPRSLHHIAEALAIITDDLHSKGGTE